MKKKIFFSDYFIKYFSIVLKLSFVISITPNPIIQNNEKPTNSSSNLLEEIKKKSDENGSIGFSNQGLNNYFETVVAPVGAYRNE